MLSKILGIDASRAVSRAPTGTEAYSYHLIRALLPLLAPQYRMRLYFRTAPLTPDDFSLPNVTLRSIPFPRLWTHLRLSWEMLQHPPDLLFVPAHVLPPVLPRRSLVTVHDVGYHYFPQAHPWRQRSYLDWSTRWNVHAATHVLAVSYATRDAIVDVYNVAAQKISVVYPGYRGDLGVVRDAVQLRAIRQRYAIPGDYILYMGRIQPRKNLARLVGAFARVLATHPDLTLVLAGPDGWLADSIHARVQELGLAARVCFPGFVAEADKAALISGARVFAYPSLYEGFGFPVLEAQACEVPLLTSNTSSLPEVVGRGGLMVDPLDEAAIAAGLLRLLDDAQLRRELVARGLDNLQRFSWSATASAVAAVMVDLLSSGGE